MCGNRCRIVIARNVWQSDELSYNWNSIDFFARNINHWSLAELLWRRTQGWRERRAITIRQWVAMRYNGIQWETVRHNKSDNLSSCIFLSATTFQLLSFHRICLELINFCFDLWLILSTLFCLTQIAIKCSSLALYCKGFTDLDQVLTLKLLLIKTHNSMSKTWFSIVSIEKRS